MKKHIQTRILLIAFIFTFIITAGSIGTVQAADYTSNTYE